MSSEETLGGAEKQAPSPSKETQAQDAQTVPPKGVAYYERIETDGKAAFAKRDAAVAGQRAAEEALALAKEAVTASDAKYAALVADTRKGEIHREMLRDIDLENHEAVLTLYGAYAAIEGFSDPDLSPVEMAAKAIAKVPEALKAAAVLPVEAPAEAKAPAPAPAKKIVGIHASEKSENAFDPEVRRSKRESAFRKNWPNSSGFGLT